MNTTAPTSVRYRKHTYLNEHHCPHVEFTDSDLAGQRWPIAREQKNKRLVLVHPTSGKTCKLEPLHSDEDEWVGCWV